MNEEILLKTNIDGSRLKHIAEEFFHFSIADNLLEKRLLDSVCVTKTKICQEHEETTEASCVTWGARLDMVTEHCQGLVLQVFHLGGVFQTRRLCKIQISKQRVHHGQKVASAKKNADTLKKIVQQNSGSKIKWSSAK